MTRFSNVAPFPIEPSRRMLASKLYRITPQIRRRLKRPLGKLLPNPELTKNRLHAELNQAFVIAVGDATTETLLSAGVIPQLQIVDGKEMRMARTLPLTSHKTEFQAYNPPGTISQDAVGTVIRALTSEKPARVVVRGEEDLLALVVAALAPEDAVILYGQPRKGLVFLKETPRLRKRALQLLAEIGLRFAQSKPSVCGPGASQS